MRVALTGGPVRNRSLLLADAVGRLAAGVRAVFAGFTRFRSPPEGPAAQAHHDVRASNRRLQHLKPAKREQRLGIEVDARCPMAGPLTKTDLQVPEPLWPSA